MNRLSWKISFIAALITLSTASMSHADQPKDLKDAAVPCPAPIVLHDGGYIGITTGYTQFRSRNSISVNETLTSTVTTDYVANNNGWAFGALMGYGRSFYDIFYIGGEMFINANLYDENYTLIRPTFTYINEVSGGPTFGFAILPGIKLTPATLSYIRLGYNWTIYKTSEEFVGLFSSAQNNQLSGFTFGVGIETVITGNYSLRGEYDHLYFGSFTTDDLFNNKMSISSNQYMLSLLYHFE
jgi:opacity protein-like surface antigen